MSTLLKEISANQANEYTSNGGASGSCVLWAARLPIVAALCAQSGGVGCNCGNYRDLMNLLSKYCK
ncbi:hypothetical protein [Enterococcus gallinarum]|uniref:hypothetical protein n=1 Tax=Enterococcus gallinarum TaxID=1353 RepID=UPI001AD73960|nr:hypothetical protein [Enterococcus gallinarum]MBO6417660.1 hypothetical protein [Enterococcus gallinarum]MBO6420921.1 hypothetical protein [Enterococcus gallinarum]